jgi:hypothetical protein
LAWTVQVSCRLCGSQCTPPTNPPTDDEAGAQGLEHPEIQLRALRDGVHRDGPLGGAKELHYNIGGGSTSIHGTRCNAVRHSHVPSAHPSIRHRPSDPAWEDEAGILRGRSQFRRTMRCEHPGQSDDVSTWEVVTPGCAQPGILSTARACSSSLHCSVCGSHCSGCSAWREDSSTRCPGRWHGPAWDCTATLGPQPCGYAPPRHVCVLPI